MRYDDRTLTLTRADMRVLLAFVYSEADCPHLACAVLVPSIEAAWATDGKSAVWTSAATGRIIDPPAPTSRGDAVRLHRDDLRTLARSARAVLDLGQARTWVTFNARGEVTGRGELSHTLAGTVPIEHVWPKGDPATAVAPQIRGDHLRALGILGEVADPLTLTVRGPQTPIEVAGVDRASPSRLWRAITMPVWK